MSQNDSHEPVTVTDKRRIDPDTGEIREQATGPAPSGPAPEATAAGAAQRADASESDETDELKSTLQRVKAEYDNYRKRALRDQQLVAGLGSQKRFAPALPPTPASAGPPRPSPPY